MGTRDERERSRKRDVEKRKEERREEDCVCATKCFSAVRWIQGLLGQPKRVSSVLQRYDDQRPVWPSRDQAEGTRKREECVEVYPRLSVPKVPFSFPLSFR